MLQKIRDKSQGPIITFIIVAICLMFAVTGVDAILGSGSAGKVAKVNGEKVTEQELNEVVFLKKRQLIAQMGENVDPAMLDDARLKQPALDELIKRKLLLQVADQHDMLVSDAAISKMIAQNPDFHQEGKFSKELFQSLLANSGLTPSLYKRLYATDVLLQQVTSGIVDTGFTTDKDIAVNSRITHQTRDIRYVTLSLAKEIPAITVSVDESKAYYEAHPEQFRSQETVVADYIELDQNDFVAEIDDKKIREAYDQEVAGFKAEEQREVAHILIEVDADTSKEQATEQLGDIRKKIAAGEDFAELARAYSEDLGSKEAGGLLGILSDEAFPPAFVKAAKALAQGETSEIVETDSGLHLIRLSSVHTPVMPGFDERKAAIKAELQAAGAASRYAEAMEKLRDLAFNSPDLAEPAQALDVTVKTSEKISREGKADGLFAQQAVRTALFQENLLNNGENSEVIELSPTRSVVVRVKEHHPAVLLAFDDVASRASELLTAEKAKQQLSDKADALVKEALASADVEALSASKTYSWQHFPASKRANPDADQEAVDAAFRLPRAVGKQFAVDKVQKANGDVLVVVAGNVQDGSMADVDPVQLTAFKSFMARSDAVEEYEAFQEHLRAQAEIDIY